MFSLGIRGNFCILHVPNLLVGGVYHVKNEGYLLEIVLMRFFNRTLSINVQNTWTKQWHSTFAAFLQCCCGALKLALTILVLFLWDSKAKAAIKRLVTKRLLTVKEVQSHFSLFVKKYFSRFQSLCFCCVDLFGVCDTNYLVKSFKR